MPCQGPPASQRSTSCSEHPQALDRVHRPGGPEGTCHPTIRRWCDDRRDACDAVDLAKACVTTSESGSSSSVVERIDSTTAARLDGTPPRPHFRCVATGKQGACSGSARPTRASCNRSSSTARARRSPTRGRRDARRHSPPPLHSRSLRHRPRPRHVRPRGRRTAFVEPNSARVSSLNPRDAPLATDTT